MLLNGQFSFHFPLAVNVNIISEFFHVDILTFLFKSYSHVH